MTQLQPAPGIAQTVAALVQILTPDRGGAGFIVNPHGLAVANVHVVGSHREVIVCAVDGQTCQAPVICADVDLAALRVTMFPSAAPLELADSGQTPIGSRIPPARRQPGPSVRRPVSLRPGLRQTGRPGNGTAATALAAQ